MQSFLTHFKSIRSSFKNKGISRKLWMLFLLSGGTLLNYSIVATLSPFKVLAGDLEFSAGSYPSPPNGPTTANQTAVLLENTAGSTFVTYSPNISVTASFSSQTYTNGLTFGATINGAGTTAVAQPVFDKMNAIGAPTNGMFTSNPNGAAGTGIVTTDNYTFAMFSTTEPLASANLATNGRYYYGDLTLTFSRPLTDPVIQIVGLGGTNGTHGHTTELELVTPGITASKLSGSAELNITSNKILNSATTIGATCGSGAACGSVKFAGTNITTLTFKVYVRGDSGAGTWSAAGKYNGDKFLFGGVSIAKPVTVSGTVFDDANGLTDNAINGTGSNAGGLFANLVDASSKVVASTAVAANGTYSFTAIGAGSYSVSISTTAGVQGATAPVSSLPSGWVNTGEGTAAAGDGTVNGATPITVAAVDLTGVNFGIEHPPTAVGGTASSQANPGGTTTVAVASTLFTGSTDPDGTVASYKITAFPSNATSITINGTNYTSGSFPGAGVTVTTAQLAGMVVDPVSGAVTVGIPFQVLDNAGQLSSNTATASLPFIAAPVTVSGTVFDDADGSKLQNGAETGSNGGSLNAVLVDSTNKVVATTAIAANGTYTFNNVPASATYTVEVTTATATVGSAPPAVTLPSNWVSTGENLNSAIDGTVDGKLSVTVSNSSVTGANIGIEQRPTAVGGTATSQTNPGGTTTVSVASTLFSGSTDPDGTVASYKITAFPSNTTSITINGTNYTSGSFPGAGVTVTTAQLAGMVVDPIDGAVTVGIPFQVLDDAGQLSSNTATASLPFSAGLVTVSGTVFSDADADVTINGSDAGTNAGSSSLTIYAIDGTGKVVDKATVGAAGIYSLTNVPLNASVTLRLSNDSSVAVGGTAPTTATIPSGWYFTGENKNGTVDGTIATLGNIALTITTVNVTSQNFGIRQPYTIAPDPAPTTCNPDYRMALNTGISSAGGQLAVGANDLNWTTEWIAGPASGIGTPYATPRPVGAMPAVVVGNLAPGAWLNEPANARWISYPFRLSNNSNGNHQNADLDGTNSEDGSFTAIVGPTSDAVRLKFTASLTLPSNANTVSISLPVGASMDNQFTSIKVNGVENLTPTPAPNAQAADYGSLKTVNITNGWQTGVNIIEVTLDSGPPLAGFFLGIQATTTQVCSNPNVLLVKRITAINGDRTKNPNDNTPLNAFVDDTTSTRQADDNSPNWKANYLLGAIDAGKVNPGDEIEYTIYFLNAGSLNANTVRICDRLSGSQDFKFNSYGASNDLQLQLGTSSVLNLTSANDAADRAQLITAGGAVPANCYLKATNDNGTLVLDVTGTTGIPALTTMPGSTAPGTPNNSYGFFRFVTKVKP